MEPDVEPTTFRVMDCPHCWRYQATARSEDALLDALLDHVDAKHPEEAGKEAVQ